MPTNLYGPNDNFYPENSHVIPALLCRFHEAKLNGDKEVIAWGSGKPMREFLYVDDMAAASVHVMNLDKTIYDTATRVLNCTYVFLQMKGFNVMNKNELAF